MRTIYYTKTVSRRNREHGYFENGDFGEISIIELDNTEAPMQFILNKTRIRKFEGYYLTDAITLPFSREEDAQWIKKQGYFRDNACKHLGLALREGGDDSFYPARSATYFLIGRRLYQKECKVSELSITICGNITFGDWWSLDVEPKHPGKRNRRFSKELFNKRVEEEKKFIKERQKNRTKKISFWYPHIKWLV